MDISRHSVKIIRLSNTTPPRLLAHCWHEVPAGAMEMGEVRNAKVMHQVIVEALEQCSIQLGARDTVVASIPETESFLRVIEIPRMDVSEISEAVQWEVAQHIPFGLENVYLDWQLVVNQDQPPAGDRLEVLVGAAERRVVDPLYSLLSGLDLDVGALELESQAIVRALISPELRQKKGLLVVDVGSSATNVVIHDRGTVRFTASLQKGARELFGPLTASEREALTGRPKELDPPEAALIAQKLAANFDSLVVEVHGVVEFYTGLDAENEINEILLTGGGANLPGLDQAFLRHFEEVHVQRGNPWVNILSAGKKARAPINVRESVHYATAIGLGLRRVLRRHVTYDRA
jgi:type IV pilus assembly protein PilM